VTRRIALFASLALVTLATALLLAGGCGRSAFDATGPGGEPLTPASVVRVLEDAGLQVEATPIVWPNVHGFVEGLFLSVRTGREDGDEGASVFVVQFDSRATRDNAIDVVAWRPFERSLVHLWTWGPLAIAVEGERDFGAVTVIDDALREAGAR